LIKLVGLVNSNAAELVDIWYQFDRPWTADDGQFQRAFGYQPATPYEEGIPGDVRLVPANAKAANRCLWQPVTAEAPEPIDEYDRDWARLADRDFEPREPRPQVGRSADPEPPTEPHSLNRR
jgi:hypothetical protein